MISTQMKKKILSKKFTIGSWIQVGDPDIVQIMIDSGFDFLVIDMEHGSISEKSLIQILDKFRNTSCYSHVRVGINSELLIRRALDFGANGIIIPGIKNYEDVKRAHDAVFYPPRGKRGIGFSKANDYGIRFEEYFKNSNQKISLSVQIENIDAVKNIDRIFSHKNITNYIIGPYDLTGSMEIVGQFKNKKYRENLEIVKKSAKENKVKSGIHIVEPEQDSLLEAVKDGYDFIAYSTDALLLHSKCKKDLQKIFDFGKR